MSVDRPSLHSAWATRTALAGEMAYQLARAIALFIALTAILIAGGWHPDVVAAAEPRTDATASQAVQRGAGAGSVSCTP